MLGQRGSNHRYHHVVIGAAGDQAVEIAGGFGGVSSSRVWGWRGECARS